MAVRSVFLNMLNYDSLASGALLSFWLNRLGHKVLKRITKQDLFFVI